MHQNAQILELNFKIFPGAMPQTPILGRSYGAPPQTPHPSALRRFAPTRLARAFGHSIVLPTRNFASTPGRTHPLNILATPMTSDRQEQ